MIISPAYAAPAAQQPDPLMSMLPFIVILVLFWFMLIRPQMKRAKEQKKMIDALQKGDEVVTSSGILGRITKVGDQYVSVEIADGVVVQVQKHTIQAVLPKGTLKSNA